MLSRRDGMTSLVLELQKESLDPQVRISDLLRKALVVSKKLNIKEIEAWIIKELEGYDAGDSIPSYRDAYGRVMVDNPHSGMQQVFFKNSDQEERLSKMPFICPISQLEQLYGEGKSNMTVLMSYQPKFGHHLMNEIRSIAPPVLQVQLPEILKAIDAIRNTILNWSLKLEKDGILGDGMTFSDKEKDTAKGVSYNITNFFGDVTQSQVQQGSHESNQSQEIANPIDYESLLVLVNAIGKSASDAALQSDQFNELKSDLETLTSQAKSPKPKLSIIKESLLSVKRIAEGATGGILAQYAPQIATFLSSMTV